MYANNKISPARKTLYGIMLVAVFFAAFGGVSLPSAQAKENGKEIPLLVSLKNDLSASKSMEATTSTPTGGYVLSDGQFVYGPNVGDFNVTIYLQNNAPHLLEYADGLYGRSEYFSINPKILLTLLEVHAHLISNPDVEKIKKPFGLSEGNFFSQIDQISQTMVDAYYLHLYTYSSLGTPERDLPPFVGRNGNTINVTSNTNAGTYSLIAVLAKIENNENVPLILDNNQPLGFYQTYKRLFPNDDPLSESNQIVVPGGVNALAAPSDLLQLPYPRGESWKFNGVHDAAGGSVGSAFANASSIDFSPGWPSWNADTSNMWVVASTSGTPTKISNCNFKITRSDGWETVYYHLENIQSFSGSINQNDRIGVIANTLAEATCNGGSSTGPHVHFTLKYNGAYVALNGTPVSNWYIHSGRWNYDTDVNYMWLEKSGSKKFVGNWLLSEAPGGGSDCASYSYNGIVLFDGQQCSGSTLSYSNSTSLVSLPSLGWNDRARSIHVGSGWSVKTYQHDPPGDGASRCINGSMWDLSVDYFDSSSVKMDREISSIQVFNNTSCSGSPPPQGNWSAQYFNGHDHWWDNNNFNNKMCEQTFSSTGLDRNYGSGAPCNNGVSDNWVAEYNATVNFPSASYVFYAQNDDGLKIWVNGSNIMERGGSSGYYPRCPAISLSGNVPLRAILREEGGDARVKITWSTDTSVCIPPANFNKSSPSNGGTGVSTSPTLTWQTSQYATKYYYCIDTTNNNNCDPGWQDVGTATSKALGGLTPGTKYYWQARANNEGGEKFGDNGTWWSFTTQPIGPSSPTLSSPANNATINRNDSVVLSWNASSGATQYYAEFSGGPLTTPLKSGWTSNTSWSLGSQWGGAYQWRVKARNSSGVESGWSETRTLNIRPGTPSNLSASVLSSDQISLTWSASSDAPGNIDGYRIYRDGSEVATVNGSTTTYQNNGLTCNTSYSYYVRAYKGSLESNSSNTVNATTQPCPPPIRAIGADTRDGNWGVKTTFNPGDPIQWVVLVENTTGSIAEVEVGFTVKNPSNIVIHNSTHIVNTDTGAWFWGLPSTVEPPGGTYTFIGSVTYQGVKTERTATYTVTGPSTLTATYRSSGAHDGYILEFTETSNRGGSLNATLTTFNLGDYIGDRQFRSILSFNTAGLPDNAIITKVTLKIKKQGLVGTNPFTTHGGLKVDIRKPFFGTNAGLLASDFQAAANKSAVATFGSTPVGGWYSVIIGNAGYPYLNLTGTTQFRLRFAKDDNDDRGADYMRFFSGNYATASYRPTLIIEYYIPTADITIGEMPTPVTEYYVP